MSEPKPEVAVQSAAVDTHCHLFLLEGDPAEAVAEARRAGVSTIVCPGIDPETSRRSLELAESLEGVFATAGMHPHDAAAFDPRAGAEIEDLLGNPRVVAVGECGLDFYRMLSPREDQERTFRAQVALVDGSPASRSWSTSATRGTTILRLLDEGPAERVVFHCFTRRCRDRRASARRARVPLRSPATSRIRRTSTSAPRPQRSRSIASSSRRTVRTSRRSGSAAATTRPQTSST